MSVITEEYVPLTESGQYIFLYLNVISNVIALCFISTMIICIIRLRQIPVDSMFILSMFCGDFLFSIQSMIFNILDLVNDGWKIGAFPCLTQIVLLIVSAGAVIFSITALTAYRYLIIIHRFHMTEKTARYTIIGIWISLLLVIVIFVASGLGLGMGGLQHGVYCFLLSSSTDPLASAASALTLSSVLLPALLLPYAYIRIIMAYLDRKSRQLNSMETDPNVDLSPNEWKLIKKSVAITLAYCLCWAPFAAKMIYELVSKKQVPIEYELVTAVIALADPIANSILVLFYDAKIKREFMELFNLLPVNLARVRSRDAIPAQGTIIVPRAKARLNDGTEIIVSSFIPTKSAEKLQMQETDG